MTNKKIYVICIFVCARVSVCMCVSVCQLLVRYFNKSFCATLEENTQDKLSIMNMQMCRRQRI